MKKVCAFLCLLLFAGISLFAQVGISNNGSVPAASAMLDVNSTTRGMLPPRMTTAQRNAIASPDEGLFIYNTDQKTLNVYNGSGWKSMTPFPDFTCGSTMVINHAAGAVAPVNKTVKYGTVTGIPGEESKCWITRNLGADHQATAVNDATEASAGWYWQYNRKQGYKHDGTTRTPNTTWISGTLETSGWIAANDPCSIELGLSWRIPTDTEYYNVDNTGGWTTWTGPWSSGLMLHAAGLLNDSNGGLSFRGSQGCYWSSNQIDGNGRYLVFANGYSVINHDFESYGFSVRCVRDF